MEVLAKQLFRPTQINGTANVYTAPNAASVLLSKIIIHNVAGADVNVSMFIIADGESTTTDKRVYSRTIRSGDTKALSEIEGTIIAPKQSVVFTLSGNVVASLTGATIQ